MKFSQLVSKIENTGREARPYSGRFMYGKHCVGVSLDQYDSGSDLPKKGLRKDSLSLGSIFYWPDVEWEDEQ